MHKQMIEEEWIEHLRYGIEPLEFSYCSYSHVYRAKEVFDIEIVYSTSGVFRVPSKTLVKILGAWKPEIRITGNLVYTNGIPKSSLNLYDAKDFEYSCKVREVYKPLNDLKNLIKGMQRIRNDMHSYDKPSFEMMFTALLMDDPPRAMHLLRNFSLPSIVAVLDNSRFKHYYKLIHPDTEIKAKNQAKC